MPQDPVKETESERIARIRYNLRVVLKGAPDEERQRYIQSEMTTPQAELAKMGPPSRVERIAQGVQSAAEAVASKVPFATRSIASWRTLAPTVKEAMTEGAGLGTGRSLRDIMDDQSARARSEIRAQQANVASIPATARYPLQAIGMFAGPASPFGALAKGAPLMARTALAAKNLGSLGAAQAASEADIQGTQILPAAALGGATGIALGGTIGGVTNLARATGTGISGAVKSFRQTPAQRGLADVSELVGKLGGARGALAEQRVRETLGGQPMLVDLLGPQGSTQLRAAAETPLSEATAITNEAMARRAGSEAIRISTRLQKMLRMGNASPEDALGVLGQARTGASTPLFEAAAEASKPVEAAAISRLTAEGIAPSKNTILPYAGPAMRNLEKQLRLNPLLKRLVNETRQLPDLVDQPPNAYEVLDNAYKSINARILDARLAATPDRVLAARFDKLRKPLLDALSEITDDKYRMAVTTHAKMSVPLNSLEEGLNFTKMSPAEITRMLEKGELPGGTPLDAKMYREGVIHAMRAAIQKITPAQSLTDLIPSPDPTKPFKTEGVEAALVAALGRDRFRRELAPLLREVAREEGVRASTVGRGVRPAIMEEISPLGRAASAATQGIGFGLLPAMRRVGLGVAGIPLRERLSKSAAARAAEQARLLTSSGSQLSDILRIIEEGATRGVGDAAATNPLLARIPSVLSRLAAEQAGKR